MAVTAVTAVTVVGLGAQVDVKQATVFEGGGGIQDGIEAQVVVGGVQVEGVGPLFDVTFLARIGSPSCSLCARFRCKANNSFTIDGAKTIMWSDGVG
jgi:hypothetical protein